MNADLTIRVFDQAKRYSPGHLVTREQVDSLIGVLTREPNVSKGYVTTTSKFAPRLEEAKGIKDLMPYRLELRDGKKFLEWLGKARNVK